MTNPLRAITLHRPWAYAIAHLGKDIENRTWDCWIDKAYPYLAIHAGNKWDSGAAKWIENQGLGVVPPEAENPKGIVAIARFKGNTTASDSPWFVGPVGWQLSDVVAIPPIECKGQQGLWMVPDELLSRVNEAYYKSKNGSRP